MSKAKTDGKKLIANNKKAWHDYFIEENKNDGVVEKRFVLPTEILFYKVQKFFKEEVKKYDILELDSLMMSEGTTIEKSHFVCREDNIYPLYNVSLLIDLYDICLLYTSPSPRDA